MTTTTVPFTNMMIHLEWWKSGVTGREVLMSALRAADHTIVPETVNVYTPYALDYSTDGFGECDLFFTVGTYCFYSTIDLIRAAGWRVKSAHGELPVDVARGSMDDYWTYADSLLDD